MSGRLLDTARAILAAARRAGADDAEVVAQERAETEVRVRLGSIEKIAANRSSGFGLRVVVGRRVGSVNATRVEDPKAFARRAVELAKSTSPDPAAAMPECPRRAPSDAGFGLYDPDVARLGVEGALEWAFAADKSALSCDARVNNTEGSAAETHVGVFAYANTRGFAGAYRGSTVAVYAQPVAEAGGKKETAFWLDVKRRLSHMQRAHEIGATAAKRVVDRLGAVKPSTTVVSVVLEPYQASQLLSALSAAVFGSAVYRKSTFLGEKVGLKIASELVTIVDDGTIPEALGSRPFDAEGIPTRRTAVIEGGVLRSFLCDSYSARKLGLSSTGNAVRTYAGEPHVGVTNFLLLPTAVPPERIIADTREGFYVTHTMGAGVNVVNGDFSLGASGRWIRGGELAEAVNEATISGNLARMLAAVDAVGSDLDPRGVCAAPTVRIADMTVAGG